MIGSEKIQGSIVRRQWSAAGGIYSIAVIIGGGTIHLTDNDLILVCEKIDGSDRRCHGHAALIRGHLVFLAQIWLTNCTETIQEAS